MEWPQTVVVRKFGNFQPVAVALNRAGQFDPSQTRLSGSNEQQKGRQHRQRDLESDRGRDRVRRGVEESSGRCVSVSVSGDCWHTSAIMHASPPLHRSAANPIVCWQLELHNWHTR